MHKLRKPYWKNICRDCCHAKGYKKLATACIHTDRLHHAKGLCELCCKQEYRNNTIKNDSPLDCIHHHRKVYFKNMCEECCYKLDIKRLATLCEHRDRPYEAKGLCKLCYNKSYRNRVKTQSSHGHYLN